MKFVSDFVVVPEIVTVLRMKSALEIEKMVISLLEEMSRVTEENLSRVPEKLNQVPLTDVEGESFTVPE